jgi:hypothetical protein
LTSDLPAFGAKYWLSGNPSDYTDDCMKCSVISLVKNVKMPILLMTTAERSSGCTLVVLSLNLKRRPSGI